MTTPIGTTTPASDTASATGSTSAAHSPAPSSEDNPAFEKGASSSRLYSATLWTTQILVGGFLFFSALMKLTGAEEMVALFEAIGIGQWFRYVTAVIQIAGAGLIVVPRLASIGALVLASTMGGAALTHLFVIGGSAVVPLVLFALLLGLAWARRDRLAALAAR